MGNRQREAGASAEAEFEMLAGLNLPGIVLHRLPVMKAGGGEGKRAYFKRPAPFDFFAVYRGRGIAIEVKNSSSHANAMTVSLKAGGGLAMHQADALIEWENAGGLALLVWRNAGVWYRVRMAAVRGYMEFFAATGKPRRGGLRLDQFDQCPDDGQFVLWGLI